MQNEYRLSDELSTIDWWQLANIMADANLFDRKAFDIARAFHGSYTSVFVYKGDTLVAAARATSDGVYYATVFDVVVATQHQGRGVGRLLMEGLLAKLPFERIFLTSVFGKEDFYAKFGFLAQTNAMGLYEGPALTSAVQRGILQANA
ncbi:MAG: GNAT family N-acetyltransferase [Alphaproteobacteria bacterium]